MKSTQIRISRDNNRQDTSLHAFSQKPCCLKISHLVCYYPYRLLLVYFFILPSLLTLAISFCCFLLQSCKTRKNVHCTHLDQIHTYFLGALKNAPTQAIIEAVLEYYFGNIPILSCKAHQGRSSEPSAICHRGTSTHIRRKGLA